jgi:hypothetical protein
MMRMDRGTAASVIWFGVALLAFAGPSPRCFAGAPWVTLQGGHFLVKRPNDGDSFHIRRNTLESLPSRIYRLAS